MTEKDIGLIKTALKVAVSVIALAVCIAGFAIIIRSAIVSGDAVEWFLSAAYGVVIVLGGTLVCMEFFGGRDDG